MPSGIYKRKPRSEETKAKIRQKTLEQFKNGMPSKTRKKISKKNKGKISPFKGKKHTKEAKNKQREASKGNKYNLGKKRTEETKNKISINNARYWKEKKQPIEMIEKRANKLRGKKHSDERKKTNSESHKGKKYPNRKSPPPFTEEHLGKMRDRMLKNPIKYWEGKKMPREMVERRNITMTGITKHSQEFKDMQSERMKKDNPSKRPEVKQKMREWMINNPNRKFKDTKIELKMEAELQRRNINYEKQIPLCKIAIVDFYLPEYRIVIQCDGCYWHGCHQCGFTKYHQDSQENDRRQDAVLTFNGFNVYRFWEHEINENVEERINELNLKNR